MNQGVGAWPSRRRLRTGERTALIAGEQEITYAELAERTDRLADALAQRGVGRGDRVAYLGENAPAFLETLFACGVLGAIFVPLNTRLAPPEVQYALDTSGARLLIAAQALAELGRSGAQGTEVGEVIVVGEASGGYEDLVAGGQVIHRDIDVSLADPAMILFTSGTTGRPKGAVLTHGNLTWNAMNVIIDYDVTADDVALMISPMFHVASLGMGVLPTLLKGGTIVLEAKFDAGRALELIERHRATSLSGVPTTYQMLAEHPAWSTTDLSSLRKLTCGGSPVPDRVLRAYEERGLAFSQGYGMTETAPGVTALPPHRTREKLGSAGLAHFFTRVRIADGDGHPVPTGGLGEVQVKGPNVIGSYWRHPEASAEAFTQDGWLRTGDLGYQDADGCVFIADRVKDMIISGGENIYPAEVERIIGELDAVASVAVVGQPDARWGEVPVAVIDVRDGYHLTGEDVTTHLAGRLARYKIPKRVDFVTEMPRTASGKIRKAALRRHYAAPHPATTEA